MAAQSKGWKAENIKSIPPTKDTFMNGWHSIRNFFGIKAFGINAITVDKGEELIKEHTEGGESPQQEFFFVAEGSAEFHLNGEVLRASTGTCLVVEPEVSRAAIATASPTTILIVGAPIGRAYQVPGWDKL